MDLENLNASITLLRDHLPQLIVLLFGLPVFSFIAMKFWVANHSAKVQRSREWFVPTDLESDAARLHYSMQHNSAAFAHRVRPHTRPSVAGRTKDSRRSA